MSDQQTKHYWGIFIILCIITGAIGIGVVIDHINPTPTSAPAIITTPTEDTEEFPAYTLDDVANHATAASCWLAAFGNVYDVTPAVAAADHPGGQNTLLSGCGKEVTALFDRIHSNSAKADLEEYKIGTLADTN